MSDLKTKPTDRSVAEYLASIENEVRRKDAKDVLSLMKRVTGKKPRMWGDSIVGFDTYHYKYASGREGDWPSTSSTIHSSRMMFESGRRRGQRW